MRVSAVTVTLAVSLAACAGSRAQRADEEGLRLLNAAKACEALLLSDPRLNDCVMAIPKGDPVDVLRRAVDLAPEVGAYHFHLAQAYARAQHGREALAEVRAAAATSPPYGPAVEYLAQRERERTADEVADAVANRLSPH